MKTPKGKEVFVFDNEGRSFDRYTIVTRDGDICGASINPFGPQGFGQFCGNVSDPSFNDTLETYVERAKDLGSFWLGKEITEFSELPEGVQKYVELVAE